ncbi:MAG TPA: Sec-independent protein translocase protein TatB [Anaeromyxobacter sp.]|nr:Sec-independent protein translocase protein TatB [Anaeromyxobacter sp.]
MFGISGVELVIIAALALILLGPDQLPQVARTLGKWMREFRRATDDIRDQLETEIYADERRSRPALVQPVPAQQPVPPPAGPSPVASPENVPGLEAALAEPEPPTSPATPVETASPTRPNGT